MDVTSATQTITAQQALSGILDITPAQGGTAQVPGVELTGPSTGGTLLFSGISVDNRVAFTFYPTAGVGSYDIEFDAPNTKDELADVPVVVAPGNESFSVEPGFGVSTWDGVTILAPPTPTPINNQPQTQAPAQSVVGQAASAVTVPGGANGNAPTIAGGGTDTLASAAGDPTTNAGVIAGTGITAGTAGNTVAGGASVPGAAGGISGGPASVAGGGTSVLGAAGSASIAGAPAVTTTGGSGIAPATGIGTPSQAPDTVSSGTTATVAGGGS